MAREPSSMEVSMMSVMTMVDAVLLSHPRIQAAVGKEAGQEVSLSTPRRYHVEPPSGKAEPLPADVGRSSAALLQLTLYAVSFGDQLILHAKVKGQPTTHKLSLVVGQYVGSEGQQDPGGALYESLRMKVETRLIFPAAPHLRGSVSPEIGAGGIGAVLTCRLLRWLDAPSLVAFSGTCSSHRSTVNTPQHSQPRGTATSASGTTQASSAGPSAPVDLWDALYVLEFKLPPPSTTAEDRDPRAAFIQAWQAREAERMRAQLEEQRRRDFMRERMQDTSINPFPRLARDPLHPFHPELELIPGSGVPQHPFPSLPTWGDQGNPVRDAAMRETGYADDYHDLGPPPTTTHGGALGSGGPLQAPGPGPGGRPMPGIGRPHRGLGGGGGGSFRGGGGLW